MFSFLCARREASVHPRRAGFLRWWYREETCGGGRGRRAGGWTAGGRVQGRGRASIRSAEEAHRRAVDRRTGRERRFADEEGGGRSGAASSRAVRGEPASDAPSMFPKQRAARCASRSASRGQGKRCAGAGGGERRVAGGGAAPAEGALRGDEPIRSRAATNRISVKEQTSVLITCGGAKRGGDEKVAAAAVEAGRAGSQSGGTGPRGETKRRRRYDDDAGQRARHQAGVDRKKSNNQRTRTILPLCKRSWRARNRQQGSRCSHTGGDCNSPKMYRK